MATEAQALELLNAGERDSRWFSSNYNDLIKKFDERFVAIKNENIVAKGDTFEEVIKGIESKHLDSSNVLIRFVSKIKRVL